MADRVVVLSSDDLLSGGFVPPQMVADILEIAKIPADRIEHLSQALEREEGFLSAKRLMEIVRSSVSEEFSGTAVARTLQNLDPAGLEQTLQRLDNWRRGSDKNSERLSAEAMGALREKLPLLIRQYPALNRQRKANLLKTATGNVAGALEIICDVRPVYDEKRERIEGLIPLTTLKITYERQDETVDTLEVLLSFEALDDLVTKANKAQKKIQVLRDSIGEWIPDGVAADS